MGRLIYIPAPGGIAYTYTKSLDLDGVNEYVNFGDQSVMDGVGAFSIVAWVKFDNAATGFEVILAKAAALVSTGAPGWRLGRDGSGRVRFFMSDGSGVLNVFTTEPLSGSTWYLVGVSTDASTAAGTTIYINGSAGTMNTAYDTLSGSVLNTSPVLAGQVGGGSYMNGKLFTAGFYSGSLSAGNHSTINGLSPKDLSAGPGTLIFNPRFGNDPDDDATGTTGIVKDRVGGFDGIPVNTLVTDFVADSP